jgi:XTP/dITP diphosphohydrolase
MILLLGTRNQGKIKELKELLSDVEGLELLSFFDVQFSEVKEDKNTFYENAILKARTISEETGLCVLADDAGLEVNSLNGEPGVRSARYSGYPVDFTRNNELLLQRMRGISDRQARFTIVIAIHLTDGREYTEKGNLLGKITQRPIGEGGFGYDPLFVPVGYKRTLAQLGLQEKNTISHRQQAISKIKVTLARIVGQEPC